MGKISPSFTRLRPASTRASAAARGASKKSGTAPELILRGALWNAGIRYRKTSLGLPGRPDLVFPGRKVAVFCDGDFWHGRDWTQRKKKLARGNNGAYWVRKIERNIERDAEVSMSLRRLGWKPLRFWEHEIRSDVGRVVRKIRAALGRR